MGNRFCTSCGSALSEGVKFCEYCGSPVDRKDELPESLSESPEALATPVTGSSKKNTVRLIGCIIGALVIAAVLAIIVLPGFSPEPILTRQGQNLSVEITPLPVAETIIPVTTAPTKVPDPFPGALKISDKFPFGSGELASEGTIYRVWLNDTYQWHNDMDNKYYIQHPRTGTKYLFLFVNVFNNGTTRVWPPTSSNIRVYNDGIWYAPDTVHYLPDKALDRKSTPIEVKEIQYYSKLFGSEYVEDFGYSHGSQTAYLYPGKSNAIDGYIVYEVPASLTLDQTYARIEFNGKDVAVWKLG
ncbi:MAG: zinc-ribbon domain-containing protein [Methanoregula sp.]